MDYCGLDLAKKSSCYCIMDDARRILREGKVRHTDLDLARVFDVAPMRVALEACGNSFWMADKLMAFGHDVRVADPNRTKAIGSGLIKNDKLDARWLARLCQAEMLAEIRIPSFEQRMARLPITSRDALVRSRTKLVNAARSLLSAEGHNIGAASADRFIVLVGHAADDFPPGLLEGVQPLLDAIATLNGFIEERSQAVRQSSADDPATRLLQTIPGVGPISASIYVTVVADPFRFPSGRAVGAYLGLVPRLYESGKTSRRGRITKHGNSQARWALTMAANGLLRSKTDSHLQRWAHELAERVGRKKACVAVARKLAAVMWAVWKSGRPFDPRLQPA